MQNSNPSYSLTSNAFLVFGILSAVYTSSLVMAGIHGAKLANLGPFTFDGGLITFTMTFFVTDIVSETFGKAYARQIIFSALVGLICAFLLTQLILFLPASPDWAIAKGFNDVLGIGSRVFAAILATFVLSQLTDIKIFTLVRKITGEKHLWLRNNVSTLVGGLVDAVVFSTVAFYGIYDLMPIIISAYSVRILISLIDTPFVYLGVYIIRRICPGIVRVD